MSGIGGGAVAIVLAGGAGVRLGPGPPKALRAFGGRLLLERAVSSFAGRAGRVLVAVPAAFPALPLLSVPPFAIERVEDELPDSGPLAGLVAGLARAAALRADLAWSVPADLPELRGDHLDALAAALAAAPGAAACCPRTAGGLEPLVAAFRPRLAHPALAQALAAGERAVHRALASLGAGRLVTVDAADPGAWPGGAATLAGLNTPEEWAAAESRLAARPGRSVGSSAP
jgi:molybdopterin-guanine dinucleotide biosynthesis protein A